MIKKKINDTVVHVTDNGEDVYFLMENDKCRASISKENATMISAIFNVQSMEIEGIVWKYPHHITTLFDKITVDMWNDFVTAMGHEFNHFHEELVRTRLRVNNLPSLMLERTGKNCPMPASLNSGAIVLVIADAFAENILTRDEVLELLLDLAEIGVPLRTYIDFAREIMSRGGEDNEKTE